VPTCDPSPLAEDWIKKGFHIRITGVELAVRPNHAEGVVFRSVFASASQDDVDIACRGANGCLADPLVRAKWIKRIKSAMVLLGSESGALRDLARGRMAELNFLRVALERYG
jgi:hypothetical protein